MRIAGVARVAGVLLLGGCGVVNAPPSLEEEIAREIFPVPVEYRMWWNEISACSGTVGNIDQVRFFRVVAPLYVEGTQFPCGDGALCNGLWEAPHDITLAPAYLASPRLVKHEMLHDLLGAPGHPAVFDECDVSWGTTHPEMIPLRGGVAPRLPSP